MSESRLPLLAAAEKSPIILDAAMGTRLIARGLNLASDDPTLWTLDQPDALAELHARDVAAGARALLTNTFGANRVWLTRLGRADDLQALNRNAVAIARASGGASRFLIGSMGPTAATDLAACREQAEILAEAGVDALVFETCRLDEAAACLAAVHPAVALPLIASLFEWPDPIGPAVRRLEDLGASALGGNCQLGMAQALALASRLGGTTRLPLWIKPSAGLPGPFEPQSSPESFAAAVPALRALGARFLGGCCGTTDAHVAALHAACYPGSQCDSSIPIKP